MKDLLESSQVFEASSILQSAATALRKVTKGQALDSSDRSDLRWSGRFLGEVDWDTKSAGNEAISGELSVQATEVRPSFYTALLNIEPELERAGIRADEDREQFFASTYYLLTKGGRMSEKRVVESKSRIELAAAFLEQLSKALLIDLIDEDNSRSELGRLIIR